MTVFLTAELVGRINSTSGGEGLTPSNRAGVEGAVERMRSGFVGIEAFPSLWDKAGALLHGLASTQCFIDGNKRTAWLATLAFLELNGFELPSVPDIEAEAAILAIATASNFAEDKATEWLRSIHNRRRSGYATDPRLEYLMLAHDAHIDGSLANIREGHVYAVAAETLPAPRALSLVTRIHWRSEDIGVDHTLEISVEDKDGLRVVRRLPGAEWAMPLMPAFRGGHAHQPEQVIPHTVALRFGMSMIQPGEATFVILINGQEVGRIPFQVRRTPPATPAEVPAWMQPRR